MLIVNSFAIRFKLTNVKRYTCLMQGKNVLYNNGSTLINASISKITYSTHVQELVYVLMMDTGIMLDDVYASKDRVIIRL